jgi:YfiH family protein
MPPSPAQTAHPGLEIQAIDQLFDQAGLVRNLRGKSVGAHLRVRTQPAEPQDLRKFAAPPRIAPNGVHWLPVPAWENLRWLAHGFSTRKGGLSRAYCPDDSPGELNLGFTDCDLRETVLANRRLLVEAICGSADTPLITVRQIHSNLVVRVAAAHAARERPCRADGLMTDEPGLLLGIQTADCIPVLVADRKRKAVAGFHAGWRGTVQRIVQCGVGLMRLEFGSRPEDLVAAIGPGIGACCYAVGEEVVSGFESQFGYARELFHEVSNTDAVRARYPMLFLTQRAPGHSPVGPSLHVDLVEANRRQLLDAGLKPRSIQVVGGCTNCQPDLFFSHRASRGHAGRMLSVIGVQPR